jgi:maltooligosyltrehalose trehalohydrolase
MVRVTEPPVGAWPDDDGTRFRVWAPVAEQVEVILVDEDTQTRLDREEDGGYWSGRVEGVGPGTRYRFALDDGEELPDPASRSQPEGVHGPSEVIGPWSDWTDVGWTPPTLSDTVLYELHVGTFTAEGTFDAVVPHLADLAELGVTTIELLPIAQFPGERNWGYDGVFPFAAQSSYGGYPGLCRLVDAAHAAGLAVCLDVVHNHLGPEGNVLGRYGPYFTSTYATPWGDALNFSESGSDQVRELFIESARFFQTWAHVDAFRLDATHAIVDPTAFPFLEQLSTALHERADELGRPVLVIAEHDGNDPFVVRPAGEGGLGMDAQWNDDLHHALHVALTGEHQQYYADFAGASDLPRAVTGGFVHRGEVVASRGRRHGRAFPVLPTEQAVTYAQNHDQVGNRPVGDRLTSRLEDRRLRLAAAFVLLGPGIPLLFMGEEHAEEAPFPYFIDHGDPALLAATREGRQREFSGFAGLGDPPDPAAEETFRSAVIDHERARTGTHAQMREWYRTLLRTRRELFGGTGPPVDVAGYDSASGVLTVDRTGVTGPIRLLFQFSSSEVTVDVGPGWSTVLLGPGARHDGETVHLQGWTCAVLRARPRRSGT